jgi:8-oxo-dGTP pyrophosphatase MutT (NUDIX family)
MQITSVLDYEGKQYPLEYEDCDDFSRLSREYCTQVYGVCFLGDGIVIVKQGVKNTWGLPGGTIEKGETIENAFRREIQEETNCEVVRSKPIGYQKITYPDGTFVYQLRVCAIVKRLGDFVSDPAGAISENKTIDPNDHKKYFDWGAIGERIIERGVELKGGILAG